MKKLKRMIKLRITKMITLRIKTTNKEMLKDRIK